MIRLLVAISVWLAVPLEAAPISAHASDVLGPNQSAVDVATGTVPLVTITNGSRFYDAFPKMTRLPSGRIVMVAWRGLGHSPNFNVPPDSEFGVVPVTNPRGLYGDVITSYSDDDGATWSPPYSLVGNIYGGSPATEYVYVPVLGQNHAGKAIAMWITLPTVGTTRLIHSSTSADGVTWTPATRVTISSIEGGMSGGIDTATGQPIFSSLLFGDIIPVPGTKRLIMQARGAHNAGDGVKVYRYIAVSENDGLTWVWKLVGRASDQPDSRSPGGVLKEGKLTEEGALVAVTAMHWALIVRITGLVRTFGYVWITKDAGETWTALGEAGGEAESNGLNMPQTGHTAYVNGKGYVVIHVGTRHSNSATPSVHTGHYVYMAPVADLFAGINTWKLTNQINHQNTMFVSDPGELLGERDLYLGVISDPRTSTVLAITHDEKENNRKSSLHSYHVPLMVHVIPNVPDRH